MQKDSKKFLVDILESISPSGYEDQAMIVWKERAGHFSDRVRTDNHGNSIAALNPKGSPRVMMAGHADEVGLMVKYIDEKGFIFFDFIGGPNPHTILGSRVNIMSNGKLVPGVVMRKDRPFLDEGAWGRVAKREDMWIDIGAKSGVEAKRKVAIGDPAVPAVGFMELSGDLAVARGFDDRIGAFAVLEALRIISKSKPKAGVFSVATVHEEVNLLGAQTSAFGIDPQVGLVVDVLWATDCPDTNKKRGGEINLGDGPVITRGGAVNHKVFDLLVRAARKGGIPYQIEGEAIHTGTDMEVINQTRSGIATGLVSVPTRYMHTPVETVSLKDVENTAKLLAAFTLSLKSNEKFASF